VRANAHRFGGGQGDVERGRGFRIAHAGESALDQLGLGGLFGGEAGQDIVQSQQSSGERFLLNIGEGTGDARRRAARSPCGAPLR